MILLPQITLEPPAQKELDRWQADIDGRTEYETRVAEGKRLFAARNINSNATFNAVKKRLKAMCCGAQRCAYCEDSAANQVEHMRPKDLYPEEVFSWDNYTYSCWPCNGPKNNKFGVILPGEETLTDVTRAKKAPVVPPPKGTFALINPRTENPLDFLYLDLQGTFIFTPKLGLGKIERERAIYTIKVLTLNTRDLLRDARIEAYDSYRARLKEYIRDRDAEKPQPLLDRLIATLQRMQHPTVWREMQRQHTQIPELTPLFRQAPEALGW